MRVSNPPTPDLAFLVWQTRERPDALERPSRELLYARLPAPRPAGPGEPAQPGEPAAQAPRGEDVGRVDDEVDFYVR